MVLGQDVRNSLSHIDGYKISTDANNLIENIWTEVTKDQQITVILQMI